jgi:murein DD-endopeptidase MepM/ murein hydrolase activator NlpD
MRYQAPEQKSKKRDIHQSNPFFTLTLLLLILVIGYKLIAKRLSHIEIIQHQQLSQITAEHPLSQTAPDAEQVWIHYKVKSGDTMAKIFYQLGLDPQDLHSIMNLGKDTQALATLQLGQKIDLLVSNNLDPDAKYKVLREIHLHLDSRKTLIIHNTTQSFTTKIYQKPIEIKNEFATATINSSFLNAGLKANIPKNVLQQIIHLFSWRIDFSRDIRKGDNFTVEYQNQYLDGKKIKTGDIIAAEFVNQGIHYYAIQYTDKTGESQYYNSNGASVRKAFLRRPVNTGYISSPFNMHRRHPILGYTRPHTGTDFATNYGTPIHATGDGRVMFLGRKGGYGRTIMLRHGSNIVTLYAHMSRFAKNLKSGQYVKENQVIGYVGTSGLSTGPHVHYEFRINNKFYDPMKVNLPSAAPVPKNERMNFTKTANDVIEQLNEYRRNTLGKDSLTSKKSNKNSVIVG